MPDDPPASQPMRPLRPLPSVGMALLPDERRTLRLRRWLGVALLLAIILGAALVWLGGQYVPKAWEWANGVVTMEPDSAAAAVLPVVDAGLVSAEPASEPAEPSLQFRNPGAQFSTRFGNALSFRQALLNAGLDIDECGEIERTLQHIVDFRRCRPEHELVIERDDQGRLARFEYHPTATEFAVVTRSEMGVFIAEQIRMSVERTPIARAGSVTVSIGEGLEKMGFPAGLATYFVEAFEGRINFATDARKGDVFRFVVDEERLKGELLRYGRMQAVEYNGQQTGKQQAFYFAANGEHGEFFDATGRAIQGGWLRTPLRYDRLSSLYNPKRLHPILKRVVPHLGIDYAASTGTPVWAAADGTVRFAGRKGVNGNLVTIRHANGYETYYAHLHLIRRGIRKGVRVKQRELIGVVGSTGRSTGPHLHFSLKRWNRFMDPQKELNGPGRMLKAKAMTSFKSQVDLLRAQLDSIEDAPKLVATDEPPPPQLEEVMD